VLRKLDCPDGVEVVAAVVDPALREGEPAPASGSGWPQTAGCDRTVFRPSSSLRGAFRSGGWGGIGGRIIVATTTNGAESWAGGARSQGESSSL
jgi:hypothetical protein